MSCINERPSELHFALCYVVALVAQYATTTARGTQRGGNAKRAAW